MIVAIYTLASAAFGMVACGSAYNAGKRVAEEANTAPSFFLLLAALGCAFMAGTYA